MTPRKALSHWAAPGTAYARPGDTARLGLVKESAPADEQNEVAPATYYCWGCGRHQAFATHSATECAKQTERRIPRSARAPRSGA